MGLIKQFYHRYRLVYLKYIPRKYKVQHSVQLHTEIGSLLLEVGELVQLTHMCAYIYAYINIYIFTALLDTSIKEAMLATFISQCHPAEYSHVGKQLSHSHCQTSTVSPVDEIQTSFQTLSTLKCLEWCGGICWYVGAGRCLLVHVSTQAVLRQWKRIT